MTVDQMPFLRGDGSISIDTLTALTVLSVVPFVVVTMTSFLRIVVVLSLVRTAIGAPSVPPNIVLTGIALILTCTVMEPTLRSIQRDAIGPYSAGKIDRMIMMERSVQSLQAFMVRQTEKRDLRLFDRIRARRIPDGQHDSIFVVMPAFIVGELRNAFVMGVTLYLPFIVIDITISAILMGLGMIMLSPTVVSLPIKLLLFVLVDGWAIVSGGVVQSFR